MIKREAKDANGLAAPPLPTYEAPYNPTLDRSGQRLFMFLDVINFWIGVWKKFRTQKGRWPILTMTIHYLNSILFVIGALFFIVFTDKFDWSSLRKWIVGTTLAVAYLVLMRWAKSQAWKHDWNSATRRSDRR